MKGVNAAATLELKMGASSRQFSCQLLPSCLDEPVNLDIIVDSDLIMAPWRRSSSSAGEEAMRATARQAAVERRELYLQIRCEAFHPSIPANSYTY